MWTYKIEPIPESGEERLWRVAVYKDGELENYDIEGVTYEVAQDRVNQLKRDS